MCGVPNDAACFAAFWQTVSNVWQFVRSASAIGSQPISWVHVGILRNVLQSISGCSPRICNPFRIHSRNVRNVIAICQQHFGNPSATFWQSVRSVIGNPSAAVGSDLSRPHIRVRHPFCVCLVDIKSVLWQLCPLAKMVRLRWLCSVCLPVCRLFGYC